MPHQCTNCGRTFPDGSKEMLSGCPDCGGNKFQFEPSGGSSGGTADPDASTAVSDDATPSTSDSGVSGTVSQAKQTVSDWVGRGDSSGADDGAASASNPARSTADSDRSTSDSDRSTSDSTRSTSDLGSTKDWPDVGSRDPSDDPTRSGDHPSRPTDTPTPSGDDSTRTPGNDADTSSAPSAEDAAQASARSDVVDPNDLPSGAAAGETEVSGRSFGGSSTGTPPDADKGQVVGTPDDDQPDLEALRQELNEQFESIKIVRPGEYELNLMELYDRDEYIISLMEDGRYAIEVPDAWRDGE